MKKIILGICLILFLPEANANATNPNTYNNVIVLIDLSNRIAKPNQIKKDLAIIESLVNEFGQNQKKYGFSSSKEEFKIILANYKKGRSRAFSLNEDLTIVMGPEMTPKLFEKKKKNLLTKVKKIYRKSLPAAKRNKASEADIWTFFNTGLNSVLYKGRMYHNKMIILTDGYMALNTVAASSRPKNTFICNTQVEPLRNKTDWETSFTTNNYGLKAVSNELPPVRILVLEINPIDPSKNTNEFDILKKYWTDWFKAMKISGEIISTSDYIKATQKHAVDFLNSRY